MRRGRLVRSAGVFVATLVAVAIVNWWVDAPLYSPDSRAYLATSRAPFQFGGWHPPLFPIAVWAFAKAGIGPFWAVTLLGTAFIWLVFALFERQGHPVAGMAMAALLLVSPTWVLLRASFWTEMLFMVIVAAIGVVLSARSWPTMLRWVVVIPLWLLSIEARYAGLFLLPGVVIALSFAHAGGRWRFSPMRFVAAGAACVLGWSAANVLKTGSPVRQGTSSLQCVSLATSFNALPYCQWLPSNALCALDPERRWLNRPEQDGRFLSDLQFSAESPIQRLMEQQTEAGLCRATNEFLKVAATRHPLAMASIVSARLWPFLGPWEMTEQWPGLDAQPGTPAYVRLQRWLEAERSIQWIYRVVAIACAVALAWPGAWQPAVLFLVAGALAHMVGVGITNPFMVLRYMAVTKVMVLLALALVAVRAVRGPGVRE